MSAWIATLFSSSMDGSYARLSAASWAVVIGVAIEETPLFLKTVSFIRSKFAFLVWNTGGIAWLKKQEKTFETVGFILLVLGLVLEIRFQGAAESAEKDMRVASEIVVQGLRIRAADAEGRIATLQNSTASAQADAARATADAARANERANGLEAQSAASQRDAEQARLEQKRIENAVAWRNLPPDTQSALAARLAALSGGTIEISWPGYDDEALGLATQLESAVKQANALAGKQIWTISDQPRLFAQAIFFGIRVNGANAEKVEAVREAFDAVAIPSREGTPIPNMLVAGPAMQIGGVDPTDVQIWVGTKPRQN